MLSGKNISRCHILSDLKGNEWLISFCEEKIYD